MYLPHKVFGLKYLKGYPDRQRPKESQRAPYLKCVSNNKDEEIGSIVNNVNNNFVSY